MAEAGIEGVVVEGFVGMAAPKGIPAPIARKLESEMMAITRLPEVQAYIVQLGLIPEGSSSAEFVARVSREIPMYTAVAKAAGIQLD